MPAAFVFSKTETPEREKPGGELAGCRGPGHSRARGEWMGLFRVPHLAPGKGHGVPAGGAEASSPSIRVRRPQDTHLSGSGTRKKDPRSAGPRNGRCSRHACLSQGRRPVVGNIRHFPGLGCVSSTYCFLSLSPHGVGKHLSACPLS